MGRRSARHDARALIAQRPGSLPAKRADVALHLTGGPVWVQFSVRIALRPPFLPLAWRPQVSLGVRRHQAAFIVRDPSLMTTSSSAPPATSAPPGPTLRTQTLAALSLLAAFFLMEPLATAVAARRTLAWYMVRALVLGMGFAALFAAQPMAPWRAALARRLGRIPSMVLLGLLLGAAAVFGARAVRALAS